MEYISLSWYDIPELALFWLSIKIPFVTRIADNMDATENQSYKWSQMRTLDKVTLPAFPFHDLSSDL